MRKLGAWAALLLLALPGALPGEKKEPFYRRFLVPGDPLDDSILLQERRIEEDPENAALHNDMGVLLARRRFPEMAAEEFQRAAKLDKKNWLAPYNLGLVLESEGKFDGALKAFKRSIDRNPGFPPSLFRAGLLYERSGRKSEAIDLYAAALRIDPSMQDPEVNPRVVDSSLMDRVALVNYVHDQGRSRFEGEAVYAEPDRFRPPPPPLDVPLASDELIDPPAPPTIPPPIRYSSEEPVPEVMVEPPPGITPIPSASAPPPVGAANPGLRRTRPPIVPAFGGRPTPAPEPPVEDPPEEPLPEPTPGPGGQDRDSELGTGNSDQS